MFEVEPNLWLQGFDAPWLLGLMTLVSEVGRAWFYMPVFLVLAFGVGTVAASRCTTTSWIASPPR